MIVAASTAIASIMATMATVSTTVPMAVALALVAGSCRRACGVASRLLPASNVGVARSTPRRFAFRSRAEQGHDWERCVTRIAADVRSGLSLIAAVEQRAELAPVVAKWKLGVPLARCLAEAQTGDRDARLVFGALQASATVGGASALALDRVAETLRERRRLVAERKVQAAQARYSAMAMSALAPAFALWTIVQDPRVRNVLLHTPAGWICLVVGGLLNAAGWAWMSRLVRNAT